MFELTLSGNSLAYDIEYNDFYMALYFPSYGARINLGTFFATPISTVKFPCSRLECRHHASRRLVEQPAHKSLHYCRAKLEVDEKIEKTAFFVGFENPVIVEIAERAFLVGNVDAPCSAGILIRGVRTSQEEKRSLNILKPMMTSVTSLFPSRPLMRTAKHQGRNSE